MGVNKTNIKEIFWKFKQHYLNSKIQKEIKNENCNYM